MRLKLLTVAALVAGTSTALYFYSQSGGSRPQYQVARLERGPLVASVSATGSLNAVATVLVGSQLSGQIKKIYVDFNSAVKKGDIIAQLDSETFEAKVSQATAQIEVARATMENYRAQVNRARADVASTRASLAASHAQAARAKVAAADALRDLRRRTELSEKGLISRAEMDAAQTAHELALAQVDTTLAQSLAQGEAIGAAEASLVAAKAQLRSAEAQVVEREAQLRQAQVDLQRTTIVAPVDGLVVSRAVDVGQTVAASLQAPTLVAIAEDLTKMQVEMSADEADVGRIRPGQRAIFTVDAFRGQAFRGTVVQVRRAPVVFQNVVTYTVVISTSNPSLKLLPGMTANVRVITDERPSVLRLPNTALRFRPGPEVTGLRAAFARSDPEDGGADAAASRPGVSGRVWVLGGDGKPRSVAVQLGIADETFTEVLEGDLQAGQEVIVGLAEQPEQAKRRPRLRF